MKRLSLALFAASLIMLGCSSDKKPSSSSSRSFSSQPPVVKPEDVKIPDVSKSIGDKLATRYKANAPGGAVDSAAASSDGKTLIVKTKLGKTKNDVDTANHICVDAQFEANSIIPVQVLSSDGTPLIATAPPANICTPQPLPSSG